jgi:Matrixin
MLAALLLFVGHQALRTRREVARRHPSGGQPPMAVEETTAVADVAPAGQPVTTDSLALQRRGPVPPAKLDRAELRRRIAVGSPGTYIGDMLADRDSMLTRWPERTFEPIRVWVQRSSTIPDWTPDFARIARSAFDEWAEVGCPVRFVYVADSTRSDIRVNFAERMADANRLGVTTHSYDQNGWIVGAEIVIATHDTGGKAFAPTLVSAIARHEVGHALGLAHSRDRSTIMFPESQTLAIAGPDRATLKLLYTLPPGSVK